MNRHLIFVLFSIWIKYEIIVKIIWKIGQRSLEEQYQIVSGKGITQGCYIGAGGICWQIRILQE